MSLINKVLIGVGLFLLIVGVNLMLSGIKSIKSNKNTIIIEDNSNERRVIEDSIAVVRVNSINDLTLKELEILQTQDSLIKELISTVDKYKKELKKGGSVTNFNTTTYITDSVKTVVKEGKIITKNDTIFSYPIYTANVSNRWYKGKIVSSCDKSYLDSFEVYNDFQVIQGTEKYGFLNSKSRKFVQVNSLNPYSNVGDIKTYITPKKTKKVVLGIGLFGGVNSSIEPDYGIGLFLGYKLIEL